MATDQTVHKVIRSSHQALQLPAYVD